MAVDKDVKDPDADGDAEKAHPEPGTPRQRRMERAELERLLANKQCEACLTVGLWKVYGKDRRTRYVRCLACGRCSQVPVIVPMPADQTARRI